MAAWPRREINTLTPKLVFADSNPPSGGSGAEGEKEKLTLANLNDRLDEMEEEPERVRTLATTYAAFLHHAFDPRTKRFHNFMSFDRRWLDEQGSEDSHGRALWALGVGVGRSPYRSFQVMSGQIFAQALPAVTGFTSPRAWAFALLGIDEYLRRLSGDRFAQQARDTLKKLLGD